jgi:hypothetical protein
MNKYDIAIAIMLVQENDPIYEQIALELGISQSTAHAGVARLRRAGLLLPGRKKRVDRLALLEFLEHGLRYVFPAFPGATRLGIPTAHSGPVLAALIDAGDESYVWPSREGTVRGFAIEPLLPSMDRIARDSPAMYAALSLVDALRVGSARERELASRELRSRFKVDSAMSVL